MSVSVDIFRASLIEVPSGLPVARRDGKDYLCVQQAILYEFDRIMNDAASAMSSEQKESYLKAFSAGAWKGMAALSNLNLSELKPENEKAKMDPDHWYELNTANAVLFANLSLDGLPELVPGRLFTTRMPRDLEKHPENGDNFRKKVQENKLAAVMILTEPQEYQKYAGSDLEAFYRSLNLQIITRPIPDFNIPLADDLVANIKDITYLLAQGKNCLVHCAGGSGRTGMIIASVFRNLGLSDPVAWIRRVKSMYVETKAQEEFIAKMPLAVDPRICKEYPLLARAIAAEHLLDALKGSAAAAHADKEHSEPSIVEQSKINADYIAAFDIIDTDKSGDLSLREIRELLTSMGAEFDVDAVLKKITAMSTDGNENISKDEFLALMNSDVVSSVRHY